MSVLKTLKGTGVGKGKLTGECSSSTGRKEAKGKGWVCWPQWQEQMGCLGSAQWLCLLNGFQHHLALRGGGAEAESHYQTPSDC